MAAAAAVGSAAGQGVPVGGWQMQDAARVMGTGAEVSGAGFGVDGWYRATVPGTVLTTLVDNKVYPEPLYGENMRAIPESLNRADWWFRGSFRAAAAGRRTWLHFAGVNYAAEIWVNGRQAGEMRGAFVRGDFDVTELVVAGRAATVAVLVHPEPHPGVPHEHTQALGLGKNGGATTLDGPTFLSTIGWDWIPAVRDRDTGIWLPVTVETTGAAVVKDPVVRSEVARDLQTADLTVGATLTNETGRPFAGTLVGTVAGPKGTTPIVFRREVRLAAHASQEVAFDGEALPQLHISGPKLWWPNGYGPQNLYTLKLELRVGKTVSSAETTSFGIRRIAYEVPETDNLTISVNGVKVMVRGGDWGLDEAMKRIPRERLDAQMRMEASANLNMIRNWVGQSTSPDFYALADKYGMLLWDEFFQPNPSDGLDPEDVPTYLKNVGDKVVRYRNHPSIAVWCARNEGYPPAALDAALKAMVGRLDPARHYQSNSADGRGVSSGGPYYWRAPREFYKVTESFKTETGSVSMPTLESVQGMLPEASWETIDDAWAQHDMAHGAQQGDQFPQQMAARYGTIRNLADFVRKGQMATYEAFRAMYEGRNAEMFKTTSGILTWMSHPAQPSFVWQLYHYDLEPNAALFAAKKAAETVHVQWNEAVGGVEVVNNRPEALVGARLRVTTYVPGEAVGRSVVAQQLADVAASSVAKVPDVRVESGGAPIYFIKLDLTGQGGEVLSTNLYWQTAKQDDFTGLDAMPVAVVNAWTASRVVGARTIVLVGLTNASGTVALMTHLQLHKGAGGRVLPVFYSDNYVSLVPGEFREVTLECATKDLGGEAPVVLVDGFNVGLTAGDAGVRLNENAQPGRWPASGIVPAVGSGAGIP
jgi:mannosylglycoprotein endo-beta-mannosidase